MVRKIAFLLLAVLLTGCAAAPVTTIPTTIAPTTAATVATTATTVAVTEAPVIAPEAMELTLQAQGYSLETLEQLACTQLLTVVSDGQRARIVFYIREGSAWQAVFACDGFVGKKGTTDQKREGDLCTPRGLYPIGEAFYIGLPPQTLLPAFAITGQTYWVDDPNSVYYNQRVEGTQNRDWRSAEHMIRHEDLYGLGFVIGYNTRDIVPGAGSAIFFHRGDSYTAGCVAVGHEDLLELLAGLDGRCMPHILIE